MRKRRFDSNWREATGPGLGYNAHGAIPASSKDTLQEEITGVNRDENDVDYLRPSPDAPLATQGAGREDPAFPKYVGALPPKGEPAWDWNRTWEAMQKEENGKPTGEN